MLDMAEPDVLALMRSNIECYLFRLSEFVGEVLSMAYLVCKDHVTIGSGVFLSRADPVYQYSSINHKKLMPIHIIEYIEPILSPSFRHLSWILYPYALCVIFLVWACMMPHP